MSDAHGHDKASGGARWSLRSLAPVMLATGSSILLGYILGRSSHRKDLVDAIRTVDQSPVPIEVRIRDVL